MVSISVRKVRKAVYEWVLFPEKAGDEVAGFEGQEEEALGGEQQGVPVVGREALPEVGAVVEADVPGSRSGPLHHAREGPGDEVVACHPGLKSRQRGAWWTSLLEPFCGLREGALDGGHRLDPAHVREEADAEGLGLVWNRIRLA